MARVPVFIAFEGGALMTLLPVIALATVGVVAGTLVGEKLLARIPEGIFRTLVGTLLLVLGISFLVGISAN
jgi:uncharacterized membrane protein YfcA